MSSINTSNKLGLQSVYIAGKQPTDPNRNPLQPGPNNPNNLRASSDDATNQGGKVPTDPNTNPLQPGPNNPNAIHAKAGDSVHTSSKTPTKPGNPLRAADHGSEARQSNPISPREVSALNTAQKLLATTLIKPILAEARAARDAPAPWGQTQAEKQFGSLLDNRIADDISRAANFPIAQRIADQILKNSPDVDVQLDAQPGLPVTYTPVDIFG